MSACPLVQQGKNADDRGCICMIETEGKWWQIKMNIFRLFISHRLLLKRDSPPSWWNMSLVFHLAATITKTTEIPHCESRRLVPGSQVGIKMKSKKCRTQGSCTAFHCCSVETLSVPRVWMWHHNWVGSYLPDWLSGQGCGWSKLGPWNEIYILWGCGLLEPQRVTNMSIWSDWQGNTVLECVNLSTGDSPNIHCVSVSLCFTTHTARARQQNSKSHTPSKFFCLKYR